MERHALIHSLPVCLLAALCAACTADDCAPDARTGARAALHFAVLQAEGITKAPDTRANVTTTVYPTDKSIGFFVKAAEGHYPTVNNRKGVFDQSRNLWLPIDSIWLDNTNADICTYAPYHADHDNVNKDANGRLKLTAGHKDKAGTNKIEELWACRFNANHKSIFNVGILTMKHLYTRLQISFKKADNYPGTAYVDKLTILEGQCCTDGTYDVFMDVPNDNPYAAYTYNTYGSIEVNIAKGDTHIEVESLDSSYDILLIPYNMSGAGPLTLNIDSRFPVNSEKKDWTLRRFKVEIPPANFGNKLEAGKSYKVSLAITPTKIEVASVMIAEWKEQTLKDGSQDFKPEFIDDTPSS